VYLAKDDLPAAEERLRQALALDADRTAAFRHQMAGLAMGGRYADMIGPLRERLARRPEAVHNVILAKALVKLGRVAEAEEATRRRTTGRGTTDGDRRLFALARAAVLLKDPSPARFRLQEADTLLDGLEADRPQLETHQRWLLTLLRGAYHAVSDDRAKAEAAFREVRDGAGGDADAHKASNELLNALAAS